MRIMVILSLLVVAAAGFLIYANWDDIVYSYIPRPRPKVEQGTTESVSVGRVIDGDTFAAEVNNREQTIRALGINTPETKDPRKPVECFGREAAARAAELLEGSSVRLEFDETQDRADRYGRTLAYVYLPNGKMFNLLMIEDGYAYEYTYDTPYKFQSVFKTAQADAKKYKRGLWADGACGAKNF